MRKQQPTPDTTQCTRRLRRWANNAIDSNAVTRAGMLRCKYSVREFTVAVIASEQNIAWSAHFFLHNTGAIHSSRNEH
jgi:hypothetical protein